ncbi:MAG: hypothetical protein QW303_00090 [Nitrososphaerota archaeon]
MLRNNKKMGLYVLSYCIRKYLSANQEILHDKDIYRFLKMLDEVKIHYSFPRQFYEEMFEMITSPSFHINEKKEKILFEIISDYLSYAPRMPILGRNLKFPLRFRTMEVLHRLREDLIFKPKDYEEKVERILLDSLYPGEHIYVNRYELFGLNEKKISTCAEKVGIFLHYRVRL